uniref:Uncharacterized protein n=1 Tax=Rhizophagus irregularis (strain DAOM 181602 / DAOM 197198 / MUCL 43194) TaxID=747089 RepID=U9UPQ8_RHIID
MFNLTLNFNVVIKNFLLVFDSSLLCESFDGPHAKIRWFRHFFRKFDVCESSIVRLMKKFDSSPHCKSSTNYQLRTFTSLKITLYCGRFLEIWLSRFGISQ